MQSCLICDDHAMMREALAGLVEQHWPEAQISLATNFAEAWNAVSVQSPTLIICDLGMPSAEPIEGIREIMQRAPKSRILVVTAIEEDATLLELLGLGVDGFAPKSSASRVIEAAINLILSGGRYLPPRVADLVVGEPRTANPQPDTINPARLSERQIEVLQRIALGQSNKEIGRELDVSPATVKAHAAVAFGALGATNRTDAVVKARSLGLI